MSSFEEYRLSTKRPSILRHAGCEPTCSLQVIALTQHGHWISVYHSTAAEST